MCALCGPKPIARKQRSNLKIDFLGGRRAGRPRPVFHSPPGLCHPLFNLRPGRTTLNSSLMSHAHVRPTGYSCSMVVFVRGERASAKRLPRLPSVCRSVTIV